MNNKKNDNAKLFYMVGASGSGKDSLLRHFRQLPLDTNLPAVVAHRYITREGKNDEDSVYLSEEEFLLREQGELFSMSWQANGLRYGIGKEIEQWMNKGFSVLINGSRGYLPRARSKYGSKLHSILIAVPEEELRNRLYARSREDEKEIEQRLSRHRAFSESVICDSELPNVDSIESVVQNLKNIVASVLETNPTSRALQEQF